MEKEKQDFNFDNSFALRLEDFFVSCKSEPSSSPKLLKLNHNLAKELGLKAEFLMILFIQFSRYLKLSKVGITIEKYIYLLILF